MFGRRDGFLMFVGSVLVDLEQGPQGGDGVFPAS